MCLGNKGWPRRNLWRTIVLSLLIPFTVAAAIVIYDYVGLETMARKIAHLEIADDINLTLLELRRYEKNILLFKQERDIQHFFDNLDKIHKKLRSIESEILSEMSRNAYQALLDTLEEYERASQSLISGVAEEQRLEGDIRPLGRRIEKDSSHREIAFDIRRHEKNYLIYREQHAVERLHGLTADLVRMQPSLEPVMKSYRAVFDAIVRNETEKERALGSMRRLGRNIQTMTLELSNRERGDIDRTIILSKRLSAASLIFLVFALYVIGYLFSKNVGKSLRAVEDSLHGLESGNFMHITGDSGHPPAEVASLIATYNRTIDAISASKTELERTLKKLEDVNRELLDRQDEIVEVQKLSAMRLLASEIAHEVNNPLSSLIMFLGLMHEDMPHADIRRDTLSLMLKEARRCQEVISELASFAKKEKMAYREISPARLVSQAIEVVKKQHETKNVDIVASLSGLPQSAVVDPILIHQALVNIIANAYQFTAEGGSIEVHGHFQSSCMTFTVRDRGAGIAREHFPYIFEPFFSTRKDGGGSGLGLALTKKIIERHNGCIWAESTPGKETVFTIKLPIEQEQSCCHEL